MCKSELRKIYKLKRDLMGREEVNECSKDIINKFKKLPFYNEVSMIMSYVNTKNEVITSDFIIDAIKHEKRVAVPMVDYFSKDLTVSEVQDFNNDLEVKHFGIYEPKAEYLRLVDLSEIDVVLVPGVVFDKNCNRIGYGAGYYDRFLSKYDHLQKRPYFVGLAFDFQVLDSIPFEPFDKRLDFIITEERIICSGTVL